ncbi:MAG: VOC family protein [Saprospiraceae bacterium]|nr:VOC family protein [Saprospiraceae bacterium]
MKLSSLTPMLYTLEMQETIAFYSEILGFQCATYQEEWGWVSLHCDNIRIMFSLPNDHLPFTRPTFTGSFYFNTASVEEFYARIKNKVNLCYPMEDFDYGMREFAFWDNNGYLLQFGKEIPGT